MEEELRLRHVFQLLDEDRSGFVEPDEVYRAMKRMKIEVTKQQVDEIVWEVDTSGKASLSYQEIVKLLQRANEDSSGREPDRLANFISFLMYDTDVDGYITNEECMLLLTRRFPHSLTQAGIRKFLVDQGISDDMSVSYDSFIEQLRIRKLLYQMN